MHITPLMLEAAYDLLRTTPPFRRWKLPPGEEIEFHVIHSRKSMADYEKVKGRHIIRMNNAWCGNLDTMIRKMAHEMVHLHLELACPSDQAHHGGRFMKAAEIVCRFHHIDPKIF